jgi:PIN like domain
MANEVRLKDHDLDKVLARLEVLLDGRVGEPMGPKELEDARKEARRRVDAGEPPGYKDRGKADATGDYLVWKQLINEAKERKLPVVFITDDRKDDWYRREHGLTLGARYELRDEMIAEAGVPLLIMTQTFLEHAKKYLDAEVSPETVDQAKELPGIIADDYHSELDRTIATYLGRQGGWADIQKALESNVGAMVASPPDAERDELHRFIETGSGILPQQGKPIDKERVAFAVGLLSGRWKRDDQPPGEQAPPEE